MAFRNLVLFLTIALVQLASASILIQRSEDDASPSSTYTYTTDTVVKPTANALFQVGVPVDVVWYIPKTDFNADTAEEFNVTIALDGEIGAVISDSVSYPGYGEQDTDFTPDETWPESNKYQIFILMDDGTKTLTSPPFGIFGGGKKPTPTATHSKVSTSSAPKASKTKSPSTPSSTSASVTSGASTSTASSSPSSTAAAAAGVSGTVLGGAIGGAIAGTLALVGAIWFMKKRMAESRGAHGASNSNNGNYPPPNYQAHEMPGNSNQPWPYQQMNAHSTTTVNTNHDPKGFVPMGVNELPTQMHHEPVELYTMSKETAEMPGDSNWNVPSQPSQQQPQKYVYGPDSYAR
ncbi:hypothetical protein TWF694_007158 [Orbilia ellipsospora]|uniref:Uncharacterized protein n=1 Tax=Orbilia ellipsospora TaxID=2528407 RepID=A0AAV9XGX1_9PEZI